MRANKMETVIRSRSLCSIIAYITILINIVVYSTLAQDFPDADHSLTLVGPDEEGMMMCSLPRLMALDTTVQWYVNGKMLKTEYLPANTLNLYESIQDLADLFGDYPQTVQCIIRDDRINWVPVISPKVTIPPS